MVWLLTNYHAIRQTRFLRQWLEQQGIKELAFATYPDDGYSYVMGINASRDKIDLVDDALTKVVIQTITPDN